MDLEIIIEKLLDLGFNRLESEVYITLLKNEPITGYKVAKIINKPTANVYKAIDSLSIKGAIVIEDDKNQKCQAINPEVFFTAYEKSILSKTKAAKDLLKEIEKEHIDERSYSIDSVELIFEKCISMLDRCKKTAVVDVFPNPLERILPHIEAAIKRGVEVFIQVYKPVQISGATLAYTSIGDEVLKYWKSQQLNIVIDGEEHLVCLMNNDLTKVIQAKWSNNLYLSCMLFAGFMRENVIMRMMNKIEDPDFCEQAKELLLNQRFFLNSNISGAERLFKLYTKE